MTKVASAPVKRAPAVRMGVVKPVAAVKLAAWLYAYHPTIYAKLLAKAKAAKAASATQGGPLSGFGDLASTLSSIGSSLDSSASNAISSAVASPSGGSSGGFWSSLGSDLSSAGSSVLSGLGTAASYLTTGGGLGALTGLANDYFSAQAQSNLTKAQATQSQAILQAQAQQVAMGGYPQAVSYGTNALGQTVPMYSAANGTYPITSSNFGSIFSGNSWMPWALGGAGLIGLVLLLK